MKRDVWRTRCCNCPIGLRPSSRPAIRKRWACWKLRKICGLRVPEDLSVIGYDDIEISEYIGLTTMRQMLYESGKRGVELLLDMLEDPTSTSICEVMPTELIVRKTTAAACAA